jgi:hypothetical protein
MLSPYPHMSSFLNQLNHLTNSPLPIFKHVPQKYLTFLPIMYSPHSNSLQFLQIKTITPIRHPSYLPHYILYPHHMLLQLVIQKLINKLLA